MPALRCCGQRRTSSARPVLGIRNAQRPDGVDGRFEFDRAGASPGCTGRRTVLCRILPALAANGALSAGDQKTGCVVS